MLLCQASSSGGASAALDDAQAELKSLEEERDEAVSTAESCARAAMKLTEMVGLLEGIALSKIKEGDEEAAKQALQEKKSTQEALEKTSSRAQINYSLAAKLAQKIGEQQRLVLDLLGVKQPRKQLEPQPQPQPEPEPEPEPVRGSSFSGGFGSYGGGYSGGGKPRWQESLEAARERVRAAEVEAGAVGLAASLGAEASIAAARERLRAQATEDVLSARSRIHAGAQDSIKAAQERLRQQDAEVLAYISKIMARYRRGDYVAEEELEFAFRQLEKRSVL